MEKIKIILGAFMLLSSYLSNASLISTDFLTVGDDLITFDTETDLEWLDLTVTQAMSVDEVEVSLYISNYGFRYASVEEVSTLFLNAGLTEWSRHPTLTTQYDQALDLINLIGVTHITDDGFLQSYGMHDLRTYTSSPFSGERALTSTIDIRDQAYAAKPYGGDSVEQSWSNSNFGSHLVRVPEPTVFALIIIGLTGLGLVRHKL